MTCTISFPHECNIDLLFFEDFNASLKFESMKTALKIWNIGNFTLREKVPWFYKLTLSG